MADAVTIGILQAIEVLFLLGCVVVLAGLALAVVWEKITDLKPKRVLLPSGRIVSFPFGTSTGAANKVCTQQHAVDEAIQTCCF
jgi:hypothetical protein